MPTFLNIDLGEPTPRGFLFMHLLFSSVWILGFLLLVFRVDVQVVERLGDSFHWVAGIIPVLFFVLIAVIIFILKWYYSLAFISYPFLAIFWFFPKIILAQGKIYLFGHYVSFVFNRIANFKNTLIYLALFSLAIILLALTNSPFVRIGALILITYFYCLFLGSYIKQSFRPAQLFGTNLDSILNYFKSDDTKKRYIIISTLEDQKTDDKLPELERKQKKLNRLVVANYFIEKLSDNLNSFKGKKAYLVSWIFQLTMFLVITLLFFTFVNIQLYHINEFNYNVTGNPSVFEFFYYTVKTITFSDIDSIKPVSIPAKIAEIASFFVLGIFLLIIVASVIFSLRQDKINENIKHATAICLFQNELIADHVKKQYGTDIQTALSEVESIQKSIKSIKKIIGKIF